MKRSELMFAALLISALALSLSYPALLNPFSVVIGAERSDVWAHIWGDWRTERDLLNKGIIPYKEDMINHPYGGTLYHVDLLNSIFSIPLRAVFGPIGAYNLTLWFQWIGAGLAQYLLARTINLRHIPALLSGIGFAFAPFVLLFPLASGVAERINLMWLPLYLLCFLRLCEDKDWRWLIGCTASFFFALIGCWHYGLFLFLLSIPATIFVLVSEFRSNDNSWKSAGNLALTKLLPLSFLCGLITIPISRIASRSVQGEDTIFDRSFSVFWDGTSRIDLINDFVLTDLFAPFQLGLLTTKNYDLLYETIYIGYTLTALSIVGFLSKHKHSKWLFPTAIAFIILALGPEITLYDDAQPFSSYWFYSVASFVPFFTGMEVPWEYSLIGLLLLSLSSGIGAQCILNKIDDLHWRQTAGVELLLILIIEWLFISPAITPIPTSTAEIPNIYHQMAEEPDEFAVFDFPTRRAYSALFPGEYYYYQSIHQKAIPHAIDNTWLDKSQFWVHLTHHQQSRSDMTLMNKFGRCWEGMPGGCSILDKVRSELEQHNFRYFVLHLNLIDPERWSDHQQLFERIFGPPIEQTEQLWVFRISETQ